MLVSWLVYNLAWRFENHTLHQVIAFIFGSTLFLSVGFGVFIVYPIMFIRGVTCRSRIIASFLTPLVWMIKESALLYVSFSATECLYYMLNPLNVAITLVVAGQVGLSETVMRLIKEKDSRRLSCVIFPLIVSIIGFSSALGILMWGQGENAYVIFLENYRAIFGSGVDVR